MSEDLQNEIFIYDDDHVTDEERRLIDAIASDDCSHIQTLIDKGFDVRSYRLLGSSLLVKACDDGAPKVVQLLLSTGCLLSEKDIFDRSLLEIAVSSMHPDIVKILHQSGSNLEQIVSKSSYSCPRAFHGDGLGCLALNTLFCECQSDNKQDMLEILKYLHKHDVPFPSRSVKGLSLLDELLRAKIESKFTTDLLREGYEITEPCPIALVPYLLYSVEVLDSLVARGFSVNSFSEKQKVPPLFHVCTGMKTGWDDDCLPLLQHFLRHGADVNLKGTGYEFGLPRICKDLGAGLSALHVAAVSHSEFSKSDLVYTLCQHGADVNAQTETGDTPLLLSVKNLLNVQEDVRRGHYHSKETDTCVIKMLLQFGASPDIQNIRGENCMSIALQMPGYDEVKLMLLEMVTICPTNLNLNEVTVTGLSQKTLSSFFSQPRCLLALSRHAVHQATKGRHISKEDAFNSLPDILIGYLKLSCFDDIMWFKMPHLHFVCQ